MTKKVTLVFPGQGSQYVGMGEALNDQGLFDVANDLLKLDLKSLCLNGPLEDLTLTENTQPALLTHSIGLFNELTPLLKDNGIEIERVLGHSVGEYAALVASGVLKFEDALLAVKKRGQLMQSATPAGVGTMYAVLRASEEQVKTACEAASDDENKVAPANFNDPTQIVISGHTLACEKACEYLTQNVERVRTVKLNVSAAFHSSLMGPAETGLAEYFKNVTFNKNDIPYIANINALEYAAGTDGQLIQDNLIKQICGAVLWTQSIESLTTDTTYIEVGPGKVLSGLIKRINRDAKIFQTDKNNLVDLVGEL